MFRSRRLRPPHKFPPLLKAASLEMKVPGANCHEVKSKNFWQRGSTSSSQAQQLSSRWYTKKMNKTMTFLLLSSCLELVPPRLWQNSKFLSELKKDHVNVRPMNYSKFGDSSTLCSGQPHALSKRIKFWWQRRTFFLSHSEQCLASQTEILGMIPGMAAILTVALLDYTYHKDTAMRRYALINAAPSNQLDSPSTMVLPTILTTLCQNVLDKMMSLKVITSPSHETDWNSW